MTASNVAALPTQQATPRFALTPQTLDEAMHFAGMMSKSSIVPKDYQGNPGNILVAIQWGAELGLAPLQAMQSIAVINGRPSIWGDAMLGLVRGSGLLEFIREEPTDTGCTCTLKRRGEPEVSRTFTVEDAKKAGLHGKQGPWQQYPKRMLQMRARGFALRDVFPDVLRGIYIGEEAQDMPSERAMGDVDEVKTAAPAITHDRASKVKDALAKRKGIASPALTDVLASISGAATLDSLKTAGELAAALESDDERKEARAAYKARQAEIKAAPAAPAVDPETGETDAPKRTYAQHAEDLNKATDAEVALLVLDAARDLPAEQYDELVAVYERRFPRG